MTIIAKTQKGMEYIYNAMSAHKVSKASAQYVCKVCNEYKYRLKENEIWHTYEINEYDMSYDIAENQTMRVYKGIVKARTLYM